jgi:hypothetical protein
MRSWLCSPLMWRGILRRNEPLLIAVDAVLSTFQRTSSGLAESDRSITCETGLCSRDDQGAETNYTAIDS